MEFGFVAITCALLAINFNLCNLNKKMEYIVEIMMNDLPDEKEDEQ